MKNLKNSRIGVVLLALLGVVIFSCNLFGKQNHAPQEYKYKIPVYGNSWVVNNPSKSDALITQNGTQNWTETTDRIRTYFRLEKTGPIQIAINARVVSGKSTLKVTLNNESKQVSLTNTTAKDIEVGTFQVEQPGYQYLELQGVSKTSADFGQIVGVLIDGEATSGPVYYVKDDFYFGRRGPSVHMGYEIKPEAGNIRWFYNELTVPEGNDVLGSYFMADGFGQGYFGIQVNSETERRILFSVWSPFSTDNPKEIPENQRIKLLKKGTDVHAGEFGNEGSGGQSYRKFFWKSGTTYRFLLKAEPSENNSTDYTAYFYAPENGKWDLIASFRRPQTTTYLKNLHSFLENFNPQMGCVTRRVNFANQWICNTEGKWTELTRAKFTADATARKDARLDYAGGTDGDKFFLRNCGFFSDRVPFDTWFTRSPGGKAPDIDFSKLP